MEDYKGFDIDKISDALAYKADLDLENTTPSEVFKDDVRDWMTPKIKVVQSLPSVQEPDTIYFVVEN